MNHDIPEKDWKKLRALKERAINSACERIFYKINALIDSRGSESHKYYLKFWKVMKTEDKKIGLMFDDLKRSTAIFKLAMWKKMGFSLMMTLKNSLRKHNNTLIQSVISSDNQALNSSGMPQLVPRPTVTHRIRSKTPSTR